MNDDFCSSPLLTIVVPCFNGMTCIRKCLDSFLPAPVPVQIVAIDDNSGDSTLAILLEYKAKFPGIFDVIHNNENLYASGCRNLGLGIARGKYVFFADCDDWILKDPFYTCLSELEESGADLCLAAEEMNGAGFKTNYQKHVTRIADGSIIDCNFQIYSPDSKKILSVLDIVYSMHSVIVKKSVFDDNPWFRFPPIRRNDDFYVAKVLPFLAKKMLVSSKIVYVYDSKNPVNSQINDNDLYCSVNAQSKVDDFKDFMLKSVVGSMDAIDRLTGKTWFVDRGRDIYVKKSRRCFFFQSVWFFVNFYKMNVDFQTVNIAYDAYRRALGDKADVGAFNERVKKDLLPCVQRQNPPATGQSSHRTSVWDIFDKIVCVHYLPYKERMKPLVDELKRVGILGLPQFEWHFTVDNDLYRYTLAGIPDGFIDRSRVNLSNIKYTIDSFSLLKKLELLGCRRVLILEDDIAFHKDLNFIKSVIGATPRDFDVMNYDPEICDPRGVTKANEYVVRYNSDAKIINMSCCALSNKAISSIIQKQRAKLEPFDIYTWLNSDDLKTYCVSNGNNICVQNMFFRNRQTERTVHDKYIDRGIDVNKYNLTYKEFKDSSLQVIVSLTSYPHRFKNPDFILCLKSLIEQKTSFKYHIVLTLFEGDVPELPKNVVEFIQDNGIEVIQSKEDLKQHKKYFYSMQKYSYLPVITVDDDCVYQSNLVEDLYRTHLKNRDTVVCGRCDKIARDDDGKIKPYTEWQAMIDSPGCKNKDLFGVGVGGILYPGCFCKHINDTLLGVRPYIKSDDFLLYIIARMIGLDYMVVDTKNSMTYKGGAGFLVSYVLGYYDDDRALWIVNKEKNYKDECIKYIGRCASIEQLASLVKEGQSE